MTALAAGDARALTVLTVGKRAIFRTRAGAASAVVHVGADPALDASIDPRCGAGDAPTLQLAAYPQATARVEAGPRVALPCDRWRRRGAEWVYRDPGGSAGGVRTVVYGPRRLLARFAGASYRPVAGPVGYAELWIDVGERRLLARFHEFRRNDTDRIVTRPSSRLTAAGEAGFWRVLHGVDASEGAQQATLATLAKAMRHDRRGGRAAFLLAMLRLYRFGQSVERFDAVPSAARAELLAANDAFAAAVPLLWDGARGDSRVPGFAAAAKWTLGFVDGDAALEAAGLADLQAAVAANEFFNVFDLIPVAQAVPASDPRFATVYGLLKAYLDRPGTLACVVEQPEICADDGLAPRNVAGALMLFGDTYAKAAAFDPGNVAQAEGFYSIASAFAAGTPGYRFADAVAARVGHAAERAALYVDGDAANDPPLIGAGHEACAACHYQ